MSTPGNIAAASAACRFGHSAGRRRDDSVRNERDDKNEGSEKARFHVVVKNEEKYKVCSGVARRRRRTLTVDGVFHAPKGRGDGNDRIRHGA